MIPIPVHKTHLWLRANSVYISSTIIIVAFGAILLMLADSQSRLIEENKQNQQVLQQLKGVAEQISNATTSRTDQINGIDRHLDCIVTFFSQADRSQKAIADIETCRVKDTTADYSAPVTNTAPTTQLQPVPSNSPPKRGMTTQPNQKSLMSHNIVQNPSGSTVIGNLSQLLHGLTGGL